MLLPNPSTYVAAAWQRFLSITEKFPRTLGAELGLVAVALLVASSLRWMMEPVLRDGLQFILYLPAILVVAAIAGMRAGFAALLVSLGLTVYLWLPANSSGRAFDPAIALMLFAWFAISGLLMASIALWQKSAAKQHQLITTLHRTSRQLEEKSARLELSEKKLAAHAAELERLVAERTARLAETVAELEAYSYTIVHDLRSPLRAMQGFAHLALADHADQLDAQGTDYLRRIKQAAERLDTLIEGVLSYSSVGQAPAERRPVDLDSLVDEIVAEYPSLHHSREGILVHRPLGTVMANEALLAQVLSILLENAAKFVPAGANPRIVVRKENSGERARLHIIDAGIGISPEGLALLFKPFHRGRNANGYAGTGMGLAIVKRAIERQGGTVGVVSEPGKGSDFWIELPCAPTNARGASS